jgi:hypothetical protein
MTAGLTPGELRQLETICLKLAHQPAAALVAASHQNGSMLR